MARREQDSNIQKTLGLCIHPNDRLRVDDRPPHRIQRDQSPRQKDSKLLLLQLIQDHSNTSLLLRQPTEKAKKEAIIKATRVSDLLVETVNGGVQECYVIEKRIEQEIRALSTSITRFTKQTDQWLATTHGLNTAVKEIGDFENWMKVMEYDCKSITSAIHNIHQE